MPGGLGVFESVLLVALAGDVPAEGLAGALVLYRLIYGCAATGARAHAADRLRAAPRARFADR